MINFGKSRLNQSKNRTFSYSPRFASKDLNNKNEDSSSESNFITKWEKANKQKSRKVKTTLPIGVLLLFLVLLLIGIYILDSYIE